MNPEDMHRWSPEDLSEVRPLDLNDGTIVQNFDDLYNSIRLDPFAAISFEQETFHLTRPDPLSIVNLDTEHYPAVSLSHLLNITHTDEELFQNPSGAPYREPSPRQEQPAVLRQQLPALMPKPSSILPPDSSATLVDLEQDNEASRATRKRKAQTLREADWDLNPSDRPPLKGRVIELHFDQDLPLLKVQKIIEEEYKFSATERQYRELFKKLGRKKNIKAKEKAFIAKKQAKRRREDPGKRDLNFKVGGGRVNQGKIEKWVKEGSKQEHDFGVGEMPNTPDGVSYSSPSEGGAFPTSAGPLEGIAAPLLQSPNDDASVLDSESAESSQLQGEQLTEVQDHRQLPTEPHEKNHEALDTAKSPIPAANETLVFTDSGYASAPYDKGNRQITLEQCQVPKDDTAELDIYVEETVYTGHSDQNYTYLSELAHDLYNKIGSLQPPRDIQKRISAILPDLLKDFAFKLGHESLAQIHWDIMVFIHKHRSKIANAFLEISSQQSEPYIERSASSSPQMALEERMALWFRTIDETRLVSDEELRTSDLFEGVEDDDDLPKMEPIRNFVLSSEAYEWLLTRLQREARLNPTSPGTIQAIRQKIASLLPATRRISRRGPPQVYKVIFELDWDPLSFLLQQEYTVPPAEALEGAITLTGVSQNAQAATCLEYMKQTWPLTGEVMLKLVKVAIGGGHGSRRTCTLSDKTTFCAWVSESKFQVEASGVAASIVEAGEQLAWLGAALRASPCEEGLVYCIPYVSDIQNINAESEAADLLPPSGILCRIRFAMEDLPQVVKPTNGQCWHDLFRNAVVVKGYPVPRRNKPNTGLEIELKIMAELTRANGIDSFKGGFCIKGFSTMLVPTSRDSDILHWHLHYNKDGSRISYLDHAGMQEQHISRTELENLRHVVGWCSEVKFYAGSAQNTHPVGHSGLPRAYGDSAFRNVYLSTGRLIMGDSAFHIGLKDVPSHMSCHMSRGGYIQKLKWISTKFVLLWDEADKRGWLINGTSALLHIVRASLMHDSADKFTSVFVFKGEDLQESAMPFTPDSATDVLINCQNMALKLYPEKDGYILFESRVEHYYNILEKLIDHQADIAGYYGMNMTDKPRRQLEGWDFTDLAMNRDSLHPRVATIEPRGKSWVDFIRSIQAVTLLGRGFGEIIRPAGENLCEYWAELPKQKYYLATCVSDLTQLMRENDYHNDKHVRLSENITWHTPTTVFASCQCKGALGSDHSEPVQALVPSALSSVLSPRRTHIPPVDHGAVIFGQHSAFPWFWGDTGDPKEQELPHPSKDSDADSFIDSGIGTSLAPSSSGDHQVDVEAVASTHDKTHVPWNSEFTVAIICALPMELAAVRALLDTEYQNVELPGEDVKQYALGQIRDHMVVAACLPAGDYGTSSAAVSVINMRRSFPALRLCLMVGIGAGVPSLGNDIRLGDVVMSLPTHSHPGAIQYHLDKAKENVPVRPTDLLPRPSRFLLSAISSLRSDPDLRSNVLGHHLKQIETHIPEYRHPGQDSDRLLRTTCTKCQANEACDARASHIQSRDKRPTDQPKIHYGLIASGDRAINDAEVRDKLAREYSVIALEMEAAGVVDSGLPCLAIRGISDYPDGSESKKWQKYAAASAAAYAKLFLGVMASTYEMGVDRDGGGGQSRKGARTRGKRRRAWDGLWSLMEGVGDCESEKLPEKRLRV